MSETTVETITGRLEGITEKPSGWTEIQVRVEGWQYPVKMATKLPPLIELARGAGTETMEWTFKKQESDQINPNSGKPFVNRYFEGVAPVGSNGSVSDSNATRAAPDAMTKEEWARKDSAIHKMACIKTAAAALTHTVPSEPTTEQLDTFYKNVMYLTNHWHRSILAERDDPSGDFTPF